MFLDTVTVTDEGLSSQATENDLDKGVVNKTLPPPDGSVAVTAESPEEEPTNQQPVQQQPISDEVRSFSLYFLLKALKKCVSMIVILGTILNCPYPSCTIFLHWQKKL